MPFIVQKLIEGRPLPVTVGRQTPVLEALELMIERDFSQIPIVDEHRSPLGMVNYEAIVHGMRNFESNLSELRVRDVMTSAPVFHVEDDLFDLLEQLKRTNAVLIVNAERELVGIVTSYDSTEFFRRRTEDMMYVEDIEMMVKQFIRDAYTKADGSLDQAGLDEAVAKVTTKPPGNGGKPLGFDDLSLGQYISLFIAKEKWHTFGSAFTVPRDSVRKLLENVRDTRNDLAHFRTEIAASQANALRTCAKWLARCREDFELARQRALTWDLGELVEQRALQPGVVRAPTVQYHTDSAVDEGEVATRSELSSGKPAFAEELQPGASRYAPLADWLQGQPGRVDSVPLQFDEIELIIGDDLPASARTHRAWWANDSQSHPQSRVWLDAGWRSTFINMTEGRVTFARIREREKAYIDFFGSVLGKLRRKSDFSVRDVSPDGASWIVCQNVLARGTTCAQFSYSFAHGRRFRVELYIDTSNRETTKQVFEYMFARRESIERELHDLSWERIDQKRASRIAVYRQGAITDAVAELELLQDWAAETMVVFHRAVRPVLDEALREVFSQ